MRRALAVTFVLLVPPACGGDSPTESTTFTGVFDLATVDGTALPRLEFINETPDTLFLTGGQIRVLSRGRLSLVRRTRWHTTVQGRLPEESDTLVLSYRESGSRLLIDYPAGAPYGPYTDTAALDSDAIVVRTRVRGLQPGVVFIRNYLYHKR